jgi:hypothetical protein
MTVFIFVIKNTSTNNFRHILWNCNAHLENVKKFIIENMKQINNYKHNYPRNTRRRLEIIRKSFTSYSGSWNVSIFHNYEVLQHSWNFHCTSTKNYENFLRVWIAWLARWEPHINTKCLKQNNILWFRFSSQPYFLGCFFLDVVGLFAYQPRSQGI